MDSLILASRSPRRREILNQLKIPYIVHEVDVNEGITSKRFIIPSIIEVSRRKAAEAAGYYKNGLVLGVDTIVYFQNRVLGKPSNAEQAYRYIRQLSGNKHTVISGITIFNSANSESRSLVALTDVYFFRLEEREIWYYIDQNEWVDKAGGYAIQGLGAAFIKKIVGSFHNVMGLPVGELISLLKKFKYFDQDGTYRPVRKL